MPIYEYECNACGHRLEKLQKINDDPLKQCPSCTEPELSKLVSAAAFRLKGGGWYETDFKTGGKKNVLGDSNKSESTTESKSGESGTSSSTAKAASVD